MSSAEPNSDSDYNWILAIMYGTYITHLKSYQYVA